jgi:predicted PurR-regulated permease PerM
MDDLHGAAPGERNPVTRGIHRRETLWQISIPFVIALALILGLAIVSAVAGSSTVSRASDAAVIWLVLLAVLPTLIFFVVVGGLAYGLIHLIRILPQYTFKAQHFFALAQSGVRQYSDRAVEPVFKAESFRAAILALFKRT